MESLNLLFDGNYLYHKTFSVFSTYYKDVPMEQVLEDKEKRQVLIRKCVIDLCATVAKFKNVKTVSFVIDSKSWRYSIFEDYKYALTKVKQPYYNQFLSVLNEFEALLRNKGLIVSRVDGAEGDDLIYVWSIYFNLVLNEDLVIVTGDSDLRQIISSKVSIFNNNSKVLKLYCLEENEVRWNEELNSDIIVETVVPFEVLLKKVIMGDSSDNVAKLKTGFGDVAFEKFLAFIYPYQVPKDKELVEMAQWIATRFCDFTKSDYKVILGKVLFNLKLTWLDISVYNSTDYITENGKSLLENMLIDVESKKHSYSYNKAYDLESFYGMLIK